MKNILEKLIIERNEAPFRIEIGIYVPDDGLELPDVQYIQFDDRRLEPVPDDLAHTVLECLTDTTNLMVNMVPIMSAAKRVL